MSDVLTVKFFDVVLCVSRALDLLSPELSDHHLRVAYISARVAEELGLADNERQDAVVAGALHDVGAVSTEVRMSLQDYSLARYNGGKLPDIHSHATQGHLLLKDFPLFSRAAEAIRFHHVDWEFGRGSEVQGGPIPLLAHIVHLADRAAVLPEIGQNILEQSLQIRRTIIADSGARYHPLATEAFAEVSVAESFWLDLVNVRKEELIRERFDTHQVSLDVEELHELAKLFARIIDYRSPYTARHSLAVGSIAGKIADALGIDAVASRIIGTAGYLHDLGKLAVPPEILDKPGKLTEREMLVMKQHPYHTERVLSTVRGLEEVTTYAALHHERLDGQGYPYRRRTIPTGARVIAVADVVTAVSEDRPYRAGLSKREALSLLDRLIGEKALDGDIVDVVRKNYDQFLFSKLS